MRLKWQKKIWQDFKPAPTHACVHRFQSNKVQNIIEIIEIESFDLQLLDQRERGKKNHCICAFLPFAVEMRKKKHEIDKSFSIALKTIFGECHDKRKMKRKKNNSTPVKRPKTIFDQHKKSSYIPVFGRRFNRFDSVGKNWNRTIR